MILKILILVNVSLVVLGLPKVDKKFIDGKQFLNTNSLIGSYLLF